MEPHTASRLKERNNNRIKDFLSVAGPLGVTHSIILSQTELSTNIRFARVPRGPTLTMRVLSYTLIKDLVAAESHPKSPGLEYASPPVLILNNFNGEQKEHQLMVSFFQNLFPPLDVANMKLTDARRVLLLSYSKEHNSFEWRHYNINAKVAGLSKGIKKILQSNIPDLEGLQDISEFIMKDTMLSDSEADDNGETTVTLAQNYVGKNTKSAQRRITLTEIGPRMTLQLMKIQDGFCDGTVLYHSYIQKSDEEIKILNRLRDEKQKLKEQRKKEQEMNVNKKKKKVTIEGDDSEEDELSDDLLDDLE